MYFSFFVHLPILQISLTSVKKSFTIKRTLAFILGILEQYLNQYSIKVKIKCNQTYDLDSFKYSTQHFDCLIKHCVKLFERFDELIKTNLDDFAPFLEKS